MTFVLPARFSTDLLGETLFVRLRRGRITHDYIRIEGLRWICHAAAVLLSLTMSDNKRGSGVDTPDQARLLATLKAQLRMSAQIIGALNQSTIDDLRVDTEYADDLNTLLSPLTSVPLSTLVDEGGVLAREMDKLSEALANLSAWRGVTPLMSATTGSGTTTTTTTATTTTTMEQDMEQELEKDTPTASAVVTETTAEADNTSVPVLVEGEEEEEEEEEEDVVVSRDSISPLPAANDGTTIIAGVGPVSSYRRVKALYDCTSLSLSLSLSMSNTHPLFSDSHSLDVPDEPTDIHLKAGEILTLVGDGDTSWNWWDVKRQNGETGCKSASVAFPFFSFLSFTFLCFPLSTIFG